MSESDDGRFYFTGKPCRHGHIALRYRSNHGCAECLKERSAGRLDQYAEYRERNRELLRRRDRANKDRRRDAINARRRELYAERQEQERARQRAYYQANLEKKRERSRAWLRTRSDWTRARHANQAAAKHGVVGIVTEADIASVFMTYGRLCLACGSSERVEIDHVVPLSQKGPNHKDNMQPLCRTCNARKGAQTIDYRQADQEEQTAA